jgi:hypothetical protein
VFIRPRWQCLVVAVLSSELLRWTEGLTGLSPERCCDGISELAAWGLPSLTTEFCERPDIDAITGAVLLVESVQSLVDQGVERSKLMKKLRGAREVDQLWAVWAEIRAAAVTIGYPDLGWQLEMEVPTQSSGFRRKPDFRVHFGDGTSAWIEFKAVGLSDLELDWHRRANEVFDELLPPEGLATLHAWPDQPLRVSRELRRRSWRGAAKTARRLRKQIPTWGTPRGIAVVARETEDTYRRRVQSAVKRAITQLPPDGESLVALWWANGAPVAGSAAVLDEVRAPGNVSGLLFVGQSVAVPWAEISCFVMDIPRGQEVGEREVVSAVDDTLARRVIERFESSSGVRPTLLRSPGPQGIDVLRRDGGRRLFPFNLLFDADPRELAAPNRPPSPVQRTKLNY